MNALTPARITIPGFYQMESEAYHADPCDTPSLSAGMINDLLSAPAKCRENSRRLNPNYEEPDSQDKFTIGTVSHLMFLEPHLFNERVEVCDFDDWRGGKAKAAREIARQQGKTPILAKHMDKITAARASFMAHPFTKNAFAAGQFEQSLFWRHPVYGFWCRCRPDFIADSLGHLCDYKATANADPQQFGKHAYAMGYYRRAAWYLDGAEVVYGKRPDHYWFVSQETRAPYLTAVVELDMQALDAGRAENDRAAELFDRCLQTGDWFGYRHPHDQTRDLAFQVGLPTWAYMHIDERTA